METGVWCPCMLSSVNTICEFCYSSVNWVVGKHQGLLLKFSATGFIVKREICWRAACPFRVTGYCSLADIVVATPGRLTDHINQTPGFSLAQLRFLVSHPHSSPIWEQCLLQQEFLLASCVEQKYLSVGTVVWACLHSRLWREQSQDEMFDSNSWRPSIHPLPLLS